MIAIVGPYGHADEAIKQMRAKKIATACINLLAQGKVGMSPLAYGLGLRHVADSELPDNYQNWDHFCRTLVSACSEVYVLNLEGWDTSTGVRDEINTAHARRIPVYLVNQDTLKVIHQIFPEKMTLSEARKIVQDKYFTAQIVERLKHNSNSVYEYQVRAGETPLSQFMTTKTKAWEHAAEKIIKEEKGSEQYKRIDHSTASIFSVLLLNQFLTSL